VGICKQLGVFFLKLKLRQAQAKIYITYREVLLKLHLCRPPSIHYIGGSDILPPPLPKDQEQHALDALECGDEQAKNLLIEHNLRLVVYIARRFENTGVGLEDLISIGTIGLIKAIGTFKGDKKIKLATYASRCVENEILMYLRKINCQKAEVSLDEPLNTDWDGNELLLSDILGSDGDEISRPLEDDADRQMLLNAVACLDEREKNIIVMRFGLCGSTEYTQKEVADIMGISQSYISRLEKRIIVRLRREIIRQSR
jgi:RNA polymerase sporulation-specific sigma factor